MDDTIWVGMVEARPGPDGAGGAYVYCAARANSVADAVAEIGAQASEQGFEILAIDWLSRWIDLPELRRDSDAVTGVLASLADGNVALDHFFWYPEEDEHDAANLLKQRVQAFLEGWIDGAVDSCGPFELGEFAFVAEMRFADEDPELGWAYSGPLKHAPRAVRSRGRGRRRGRRELAARHIQHRDGQVSREPKSAGCCSRQDA